MRIHTRWVVVALVVITTSVFPPPAHAGFVEDVRVIHTFRGVPTSRFGWGVAEIADMDGDGVKEVATGAPFVGVAGPSPGLAVVYSGRTGELLHLFPGLGAEQLGFFVADAGDVDADGTPDLVVGAPMGGALTGRAYVYSGRTGETLHTIDGEVLNDKFGFGVSAAGDVDRDGHADVLVGAPEANGRRGRAYIISGADGGTLRLLEGESPTDRLGSGVASVGDVDRDGVSDHVIAARDAGSFGGGRVYVHSGADGSLLWSADPLPTGGGLGHFFVAGMGDANADGIPDVYAGDFADSEGGRAYVFSGRDGTMLHAFEGNPGAGLGPGRGAGDLDGDGHADVVAGSYTSDDGGFDAGKIEVFSGRDGSVLRTITSTMVGEQLGFDAVGLGDVDGDGRPDILASAANGDTVYVIAGT